MSNILRYEAWTLPWDSAGFHRKIARLPAVDGGGSVEFLTTAGQSRVGVADFPRIATLISPTEGSLIRVFDGASVIDDWLAKRNRVVIEDEQRIHRISGNALKSQLDKILIRPQDDTDPTTAGEWIWGGRNLIANPGYETGGAVPQEWELSIDATGGDYTLSDGVDTTGAIAFDAQASTIATAIQNDLGTFVDVVVVGTSVSPYLRTITAFNPPTGLTLTINDAGLTGGAATGTVTATEDGEIRYAPWESNRASTFTGPPNYNRFEVTDEQADTGLYSLAVQPRTIRALSSRNPGVQQVVSSVKPGQTYQWSKRIRPTQSSDVFRIALYTFGGDEFIAAADPSVSINVWQTISLPNVVIPTGVTQVRAIVHWANYTNTTYSPGLAYFDNGVLQEGFAAAPAGAIATVLFTTGVAAGILDWLDITTWSDTLDSAGNAWPEDLNVTVPWGSTVGQFLDQLVDLKYEWEIVPKTPIGEITAGNPTHDLNIYGPGGRDDDPDVGIAPKQGVTAGSTVFRIPEFTRVLVEGAEGGWTVVDDAAAQADFGEMETFSRQLNLGDEATRTLAGEQWLEFEAANRNAVEYSLAATSFHHHPLVDYRPGDTIAMQVPPNLPRELRRVQRVDYSFEQPTGYKVVGSRVLEGEAAAYDLVWRMWRRFQRVERGEGGGVSRAGDAGAMVHVLIVSESEPLFVQGRADFVIPNTNSSTQLQEAFDSITSQDQSGAWSIWMAGIFELDADVTTPSRSWIRGLGDTEIGGT